MTAPRLAVVIPTRNRVAFLAEAVSSVLAQDSDDWELVIVDDASSDGTAAWLAALQDPRVRVHANETQQERSASRNLGVSLTTAPYLLFLDDDDLLRPGAVRALMSAALADPQAAAVIGGREDAGPDFHRRYVHPRRRLTCRPWADMLFGWMPGTPQIAIRRDVFDGLGGWEVGRSFGEDLVLWLKTFRHEVVLVPETLATCRYHEGQARPPDASARDMAVRREFLVELPASDRERGGQMVRARPHFLAALDAYAGGRYREAARGFTLMFRVAPSVIRSPTVGGWLVSLALRSVAGSVAPRLVDRARGRAVEVTSGR